VVLTRKPQQVPLSPSFCKGTQEKFGELL